MEYRPYYLAREWVRAGHRVMIVAASFSHVRSRQPEVAERSARRHSTTAGCPRRRTAATASAGCATSPSFLRQVWTMAPQLVAAFRPDVVIGSSTYPMDCWPARRIARLAGATLVHEVHDLWPLSPIELSGMSKWHPFALLCQRAENSAYRHADLVVSMLPKVHAHMAAHGLDLARLAIVPNGISPDDWQATPQPLRADVQQALDAAHAASHAVVGYAGSMGEPNALDTLLDAAALSREKPLRFVLVGDGHLRAHLASRIAAEGLGNVALQPPVPKVQVPSLLGQIDIAFIGWQRVPIYRFGIAPNKLMDYMMAGCPVLHSVEAGNDPVAEAGCGLTVAPATRRRSLPGCAQLAALPAPSATRWASVAAPSCWRTTPTRCWRGAFSTRWSPRAGHERIAGRTAPPWPRATRAARRRALQLSAARCLADRCRSASARCWRCSRARAGRSFADKRVLEVGCGGGGNLLELLRLGFAPEHMTRHRAAARTLRAGAPHAAGRAAPDRGRRDRGAHRAGQPAPRAAVHRLLLAARRRHAQLPGRRRCGAGWRPAAQCCGTTSPSTTRATPTCAACRWRELRALFPQARIVARRVTLAPPLARAVCRIHPRLYPLLNAVPLLRTHVLAWLAKH